MKEAIDRLLVSDNIHPVLVDVGASSGTPEIWNLIAPQSVYVGFDPDLREIRELQDGRFWKAIIVNEAVTDAKTSEEVEFYLTKSPYCSSTLKPDTESLSNFLFADLFLVERCAKVQATSLDSVMNRLALSRIDWLKTDSQGTDLRIFNSLTPEVRSRVLAIDIEPGLIDAYVGEDLFVDAHKDLTQNGFWLSNVNICGAVRMRKSAVNEIAAVNKNLNCNLLEDTLKKSPGWCEARYLRTIEWLAHGGLSKRDFLLLWSFALLDDQLGFAIDVGIEYEKVFGKDDASKIMREEPVALIKHAYRMKHSASITALPVRIMRRLKRLWRVALGDQAY
jgi:FkbM family methyltransferase